MAIADELQRLTVDASDPSARVAQTFPRLVGELAARVAAYGHEQALADGEPLFVRGERECPGALD